MTKKLSAPQLNALRYAKGRQLYAKDVNEGNGNMRRTLLWLLKHELLAWDPIYTARIILTKQGAQKLDEARTAQRPQIRSSDTRSSRERTCC